MARTAKIVNNQNDIGEGVEDTMASGDMAEPNVPKKKQPHKVKNADRANQTVFGVTGAPIVFDADGIAEPSEADLEHLLKVPGYEGV